ncbi:MAG: hypothetical protein AMXMBFR12_04450 [Candidatus Babeliales bacterium]
MAEKNLSIFEQPSSISPKPKHAITHWKLYVDGAARNNPGPAGAGVYITKNDKPEKKIGYYLGKKTNNQAEYGALLIGLYLLKKMMHDDDHLDIISDSLLLVRQFQGEYRVKHPELKPLHLLCKKLLEGRHYAIAHVLREYNEVADEMANKGIDDKKALPQDFLTFLQEYGINW